MPFPLPEAPVDAVVGLYGQFDDAELSAIVQSSGDVLAHDDPVRHLLTLREQPYLLLLEEAAGGETRSARAYKSAVCLGATMLRRFARAKEIDLTELHVNPTRTYLHFPDLPLREARRRYGAWPIMTEDFTDPQYYGRFFQSKASALQVKGLQSKLIENHIGFMQAEAPGARADNFGMFCRGLLDTFELYAQLRREAILAPPDQLFDPAKHRELNATASWMREGDPTPDLALRWRVGGIASARLRGGTVEVDETLGSTTVSAQALVLGVSRAIGGYVRQTEKPDSPALPVLFKGTEERFELTPEDTLIIRTNRGDSALFSQLRYPFLIPDDPLYPSAQVVALCRDGEIKFLHDPTINLDTEESTLGDAIPFEKMIA